MFTPSSESLELDFDENFYCDHQDMCIHGNSFYSPLDQGYMHPYSCFAHVKQTQPVVTKKNNPYGKVYDWYTRDRCPRNHVKTLGAGLYSLPEDEVRDFSRWLDYKYVQYLEEMEYSKYEYPGSVENEYDYAEPDLDYIMKEPENLDYIKKEPENLDYIMKPKVTNHKSSVLNVPLIDSYSSSSADKPKINMSYMKQNKPNKPCCKTCSCKHKIPDMGSIIVPNTIGKVGKKILPEKGSYIPAKTKSINVETQSETAPSYTEQPEKQKTVTKKQTKKKTKKTKDCATGPSVIFLEVKDSPTYQTDSYVKASSLRDLIPNDLNEATSDELYRQLQGIYDNEQAGLLPSGPGRNMRYECGCINDTSQTSDVALNVNDVLNEATFVKIIQRRKNPKQRVELV